MHNDFNYINDNIIIGSDSPNLLDFLNEKSVDAVVNLRTVSMDTLSTVSAYLWLPTTSNSAPNSFQAKEAAVFIDTAIRENKIVYVHCSLGQSRAPTLVIAYLMLVHDYSLKDAYNLVKEGRPVTRLSYEQEEFLKQLKKNNS